MSDPTARDLAKTVTRSLPTEQAMDRYGLWGDRLDAVVAASNGTLRLRSPGMVEAVRRETTP